MNALRSTSLLAIVSGVALLGCDFGSDQMTVTLRQETIFRHTFSSDTVTSGAPLILSSEDKVSFVAALTDRGYDIEQVESARVVDGFVEVIFPIDGKISFTNRAGVRLTYDHNTTAEVAVAENLAVVAAADDAALSPNVAVDVSAVIRGGSFGTDLVLAPNETIRPDSDYDLAVKLVFELVVALR